MLRQRYLDYIHDNSDRLAVVKNYIGHRCASYIEGLFSEDIPSYAKYDA